MLNPEPQRSNMIFLDSQTPPVKEKPMTHYPSKSMPAAAAALPVDEDKASHLRHVKMSRCCN